MAKTEGFAKVVVCDAGPLIHLDELDCLDLLGDYPEVLVPEAVWREVLRHRPLALEKKTAVLVRVAPSPGQPAPLLRGLFETMSLHRAIPTKSTLHLKRSFLATIIDQVDREDW